MAPQIRYRRGWRTGHEFSEDVRKGHWHSPGKRMSSRRQKTPLSSSKLPPKTLPSTPLLLLLPGCCCSVPTCIYLSQGEPEDFLPQGPKLLTNSELATPALTKPCCPPPWRAEERAGMLHLQGEWPGQTQPLQDPFHYVPARNKPRVNHPNLQISRERSPVAVLPAVP